MLFEAWQRLSQPPEIATGLMLAVAIVGLAANGVSFWLLREPQVASLNMRGAYLEVLGDLAGSARGHRGGHRHRHDRLDPGRRRRVGRIALLILPRTYGLLREAIDVLLEATPKGVDMGQVRAHILEAPGVDDVHDLHAWTITSGLNVVSAHVVLDPGADAPAVLDALCTCLADDLRHRAFDVPARDRATGAGSRNTATPDRRRRDAAGCETETRRRLSCISGTTRSSRRLMLGR